MATTDAQIIANEGNGQQEKLPNICNFSASLLVAANRHKLPKMPSEGRGRTFESCRVRQFNQPVIMTTATAGKRRKCLDGAVRSWRIYEDIITSDNSASQMIFRDDSQISIVAGSYVKLD